MRVLGIIAEYNPFHNGHAYHIQTAKEQTNADAVVVVMSGSFTQAGNIAVYDKFSRAKLATKLGVDLVLELPTIYACSSANYFASGAIWLLDKLGMIDCLCFGSECEDICILQSLADIVVTKEDEIIQQTTKYLKTGISYAVARQNAIASYITEEQLQFLHSPNTILGLEYLKALKKQHSSIIPYVVKRRDSDFNEMHLNRHSKQFTSATSIRKALENKDPVSLDSYLPEDTLSLIEHRKPIFNASLFPLFQYKLITTPKAELSSIFEMTEGLENKFLSCIEHATNYEDLIQQVKSKRYQMSKIKRIVINTLLSIKKQTFNDAFEKKITYAHVLACSETGKQLLSKISINSSIPLITSLNPTILTKLPPEVTELLTIDIMATNLHSMLNAVAFNSDFTNQLSQETKRD